MTIQVSSKSEVNKFHETLKKIKYNNNHSTHFHWLISKVEI